MTISQDIKEFNEKIKEIGFFIKELYNIKKVLILSINHCTFHEDGKITISHPDLPSISFYENDINNIEKIKKDVIDKADLEKQMKYIHELKFQIDYWMHQTSPEFITKKQKNIEEWKKELETLEQK